MLHDRENNLPVGVPSEAKQRVRANSIKIGWPVEIGYWTGRSVDRVVRVHSWRWGLEHRARVREIHTGRKVDPPFIGRDLVRQYGKTCQGARGAIDIMRL